MKIKKKIQGQTVELELEQIKDYGKYILYQVYKIVEGKRVPIYKTCYTNLQIQEIIKRKYWIFEEVFK